MLALLASNVYPAQSSHAPPAHRCTRHRSRRCIVSNIENVTQSHIHIAPKGVNGPVVVFLFGFVAGGVTENGLLAEGTITQSDLIARPAIGFGATMAELIAAMRSGNAYVNVHTVALPAGGVRGQVR